MTRLPANRICPRPARLEPARRSPDNFAAAPVAVVVQAGSLPAITSVFKCSLRATKTTTRNSPAKNSPVSQTLGSTSSTLTRRGSSIRKSSSNGSATSSRLRRMVLQAAVAADRDASYLPVSSAPPTSTRTAPSRGKSSTALSQSGSLNGTPTRAARSLATSSVQA